MLSDLDKECLKDIGITALGDVITILKHAKHVAEKETEQQMLMPEPNNQASSVKLSKQMLMPEPSTRSSSLKSSTAASRMVGHYINKSSPVKNKRIVLKRACDDDDEKLEVPIEKKRRVLPENEGGYIIKMPSGMVRRTQPQNTSNKQFVKTIFNRLGSDGNFTVSSTTDEQCNTSSSSSFGKKNLSVFSRLGSSNVQEATSTSDVNTQQLSLPYQGILKRTVSNRSPVSAVTRRKTVNANSSSLSNRIEFRDLMECSSSTPSKIIYLKKSNTNQGTTGVKTRLGGKTPRNDTIVLKRQPTVEKNVSKFGGVFARLGPLKRNT